MQDDAAAWERQVYTFAQHRQLPVLAPHIPIGIMAPQLRRQAYEMVRPPDGGTSVPMQWRSAWTPEHNIYDCC